MGNNLQAGFKIRQNNYIAAPGGEAYITGNYNARRCIKSLILTRLLLGGEPGGDIVHLWCEWIAWTLIDAEGDMCVYGNHKRSQTMITSLFHVAYRKFLLNVFHLCTISYRKVALTLTEIQSTRKCTEDWHLKVEASSCLHNTVKGLLTSRPW